MPKGVYRRSEATIMQLKQRAEELRLLNKRLFAEGRHCWAKQHPWIGRKHTEEYKRRMSAIHKGAGNPFYGHSHSVEHQEKLRQLSVHRRGPLSPTWRGGKGCQYGSGFSFELKEQVRKRDGNRCRICGIEGGKYRLDVHHRNGDKDVHDLDNLITLCRSCHLKIEYGSLELNYALSY